MRCHQANDMCLCFCIYVKSRFSHTTQTKPKYLLFAVHEHWQSHGSACGPVMTRMSCILLILSHERNETQCKCDIHVIKTKICGKCFEPYFATFNRNNEPHHEKTYKNKVANLISAIVSLYIKYNSKFQLCRHLWLYNSVCIHLR